MGRIKEWEELAISDNFLFQKVMQNKRICKRLIEKLLGISVKSITYPTTEKAIEASPTQQAIRLDLYVEIENGTIIDIEMQTANKFLGCLPKRTRYYQAMIDLNVLGKGKDYIERKQSFVIFICTFAPFHGSNRKIYTFSNRCQEQDGLELGDDAIKIFLNAKGTTGEVDEDIDRFLAYVDGKAAEGEFALDIAAEVDRIKQHDETRVEYMTLMMELREQRREGYDEGKESATLASIRNLMKTSKWTAQQAMDALLIPSADQKRYASQLQS